MTEQFEENLGVNTYIDLPQLKDYLAISSNTQDARLSNIISYATSVIEHYIGQEILANDYVEVFDGGTNALYVNRLPLSNVYQITEFDGSSYNILADASVTGGIPTNDYDTVMLQSYGVTNTAKVKRFGKSAGKVSANSYIAGTVTDGLTFEEGDFTVEMFVRLENASLQDSTVFSINTDASNYMKFSLANAYGLSFEANIAGSATLVQGANTSIEAQEYYKRQWSHISVSRDLANDRLYLTMNGNVIANVDYTVADHSFTSNVLIGESFTGYLDEIRVSTVARYKQDFNPPTYRFRPDSDTSLLIHFDEAHESTKVEDAHSKSGQYVFTGDTGKITKNSRLSNKLELSMPSSFAPYPSGVSVLYRAGYEPDKVPLDLQLVTLDFIKILYKQDQEKKGFSFEGEKGYSFPLSANFPAHIARVLDLYRIIK